MDDFKEFQSIVGTEIKPSHKYLKYFSEQEEYDEWYYTLLGSKNTATELRKFHRKDIYTEMENLILEKAKNTPVFIRDTRK